MFMCLVIYHSLITILVFGLNVSPHKQKGVYRTLYNYYKAGFDIYRDNLCSAPWDLATHVRRSDDWWCWWKDLTMTKCDHKSYVDTITSHLDCLKKPFSSWANKLIACRSPKTPLAFNNNLDSAKADFFNNYFASIFTKERTMNSEECVTFLSSK